MTNKKIEAELEDIGKAGWWDTPQSDISAKMGLFNSKDRADKCEISWRHFCLYVQTLSEYMKLKGVFLASLIFNLPID